MQKKFITLAVIAAFSTPAFADVTPYGIIDAAVVNVSASGQKSDLLAYSGGLSGSRIGAKVTEDLGDGLTAVGVLEYALDTEVSTGLSTATARQQMLAVAGGFGTVASGYLQTTGYDFGVKFDPTAGSAISVLQAVTKGGGFLIGSAAVAARAQRAVAYISPDLNGLTLAVNYSTALAGLGDLTVADTATTGLKTSAYLLSGNYTAGPLNVGLVYAGTNNASSGAATTSEYALGGSYDLGVAKILATYQANSTSAATAPSTVAAASKNSALSLTGVVPVGGDAVVLTYAANTMETANTNGSGYSLGYLRTLSKTTTAYAAYSGVTNGSATHSYSVINNALSAASLTNGGTSSLIAIGLRKKF